MLFSGYAGELRRLHPPGHGHPRPGGDRIPHAVLRGRGQPREAGETPALFSAGLPDDITAPSTVFAAFNHYAGPKAIAVYEFNGHEGGGTRHLRAKLDFLEAALAG